MNKFEMKGYTFFFPEHYKRDADKSSECFEKEKGK